MNSLTKSNDNSLKNILKTFKQPQAISCNQENSNMKGFATNCSSSSSSSSASSTPSLVLTKPFDSSLKILQSPIKKTMQTHPLLLSKSSKEKNENILKLNDNKLIRIIQNNKTASSDSASSHRYDETKTKAASFLSDEDEEKEEKGYEGKQQISYLFYQ